VIRKFYNISRDLGKYCSLYITCLKYYSEIEVPRNEGLFINKGRAFIEYTSSEEAKKVNKVTLL